MKSQPIDWLVTNFLYKPDKYLLDQEYKILQTKFEKKKYEDDLAPDSNVIVARLNELFKLKQSWTNLSQIELFLVSLYTDEEVDMELKLKLLETDDRLAADTLLFFQMESQKEENNIQKRILLNRLNEKLQVGDDIMDLEKNFVAKTRVRTSLCFLVAITLFFAVDQLPQLTDLFDIKKGFKSDAVLTAMASGLMGTSFSMLLGLKSKLTISSLEDLKVIHRIDYLFSRTIIGLTSGLVLFYFFHSELVSGTIFPVFEKTEPILRGSNYSLLVLWCFISGFSEKLVPDLIAKSETKLSSTDNYPS